MMKSYFSICLLLFSSCIDLDQLKDPEPEDLITTGFNSLDFKCKIIPEFSVQDKQVCSKTETCSISNLYSTNSYLCICDQMCLCFFTKLQGQDTSCTLVKIDTCTYKKSLMLLLNGDYCELSEEKRDQVFKEFKSNIPEGP